MRKTLSCLLPLLLLGGCQLPLKPQDNSADGNKAAAAANSQSKQPTVVEPKQQKQLFCYIAGKRHLNLLARELRFIQAAEGERQSMLSESRKAQDYAQTALLLSQVSSDSNSLAAALVQYNKQGLRDHEACVGDRYLLLRKKQTELLLARRQNDEKQQGIIHRLRRQIEALTAIESELEQEREQIQ
ncbi:hypothetical protein [Marinobacterium jannaschii]|uniref:hypothetical protein n=1 Tax=Marinobacterium jannaschii TaxID=64970 RepID=UPI000484A852|nr:hypothetical protein [Marinobacterium jannaschii]